MHLLSVLFSAQPKTIKVSRLPVAIFLSVASVLLAVVMPAPQQAHATTPACGATELASGSWLSGGGVDVYANSQGGTNWGYSSCGGTDDYVNGVDAGGEWQCVELVNRLYLTKGWTSSHWFGNGNTLGASANLPSNTAEQSNGSISHVTPGDVITFDNGGAGHAAIVDSVDSDGSLMVVNQNTPTVVETAPLASGSLAGHNATYGSYLSNDTVQYIIHSSLNTGEDGSGPPPQPDMLLALTGNTLYSKVNIGDEWTTQTTAATEVQANGGRIGIIDTSGNLEAKDGPNGTWDTETGAVSQYVVTPNLLVVNTGGTVNAKAQLTDEWTSEVPPSAAGAAEIGAAGNTMGYLDTNGNLYAQVGVGGGWQFEIGSVSEFAVTDDVLLALVGNTLYAKVNIGDEWTTEAANVASVEAAGSRIAVIDTSGNLDAKDGPNGTWYTETGNYPYVVTPNLLIVNVNGTVYTKAQLGDEWTPETPPDGLGATDIEATNNTWGYLDASGTLWAQIGVSGGWLDEIGSVTQFVVS